MREKLVRPVNTVFVSLVVVCANQVGAEICVIRLSAPLVVLNMGNVCKTGPALVIKAGMAGIAISTDAHCRVPTMVSVAGVRYQEVLSMDGAVSASRLLLVRTVQCQWRQIARMDWITITMA